MSPDARRRTRRRLLLAGLPLALAALALQWKLAVMLDHDRDGRSDYAAGSYADAQAAFARNGTLNVVETWISPYDEGTARYRLEDFAGAARALEEALSSVPPDEECRVRINLALTHEAVGDAAAPSERAPEAWQEGLDVLQQGGCEVLAENAATGAGASSHEQADDARSVAERLRDKLEDPAAAAADPAAQTRAELLEERNEQAKRDRRKLEEKKQDQADAPPEDQPGDQGDPPTYAW
jgi:hypothetical protein